jgi:hypothetical protein
MAYRFRSLAYEAKHDVQRAASDDQTSLSLDPKRRTASRFMCTSRIETPERGHPELARSLGPINLTITTSLMQRWFVHARNNR